jgi:hypothetical protein
VEEQQAHGSPVEDVVAADLDGHDEGVAPELVLPLVLSQSDEVQVLVQIVVCLCALGDVLAVELSRYQLGREGVGHGDEVRAWRVEGV